MKKKLLALAIVLVMIISMLPVTAFAASPRPKVRMCDPAYTNYLEIRSFTNGTTEYVIFEDVVDAETQQVIGNKPVLATEVPTDNYIQYTFADGVFTITMKNVDYKRSAIMSYNKPIIQILSHSSSYTAEFDVVLNLEGTNKIEGRNVTFTSSQIGLFTITGSGSLTADVEINANAFFHNKSTGDLLIKDTTLNLGVRNISTGTVGTIVAKGAITIDNSTLNITGNTAAKGYCITTGTDYSSSLADTTKGITIQNGSNVYAETGSTRVLLTKGAITIDNSNAEFVKSSTNNTSFASSLPYLIGEYSSVQVHYNGGENPGLKDLSDYDIAEGDALTETDRLIHYKAVVKTAGGEEPEPECTHANAAQQEFCDVAVVCPDCGQEVYPAKEHTAADDGNCLTADLCTVCGKEAVAAADAHVPEKELTNCLSGVKCANCTMYAIEPAASHTGGEDRPCGEHRTCEICGQRYGAKKAHSDTKTAAQAATCTEAGHAAYWTCKDCGKIFADSANTIEITDLAAWLAEGGEGYDAATGHTEGEPTVDPETNEIVVSCTVCGEEISRVPAEEPECEHTNTPAQEYCDVAVNCPDCGEEVYAAKEHTEGAAADCVNDQICTVCEKVLVEKLGHTPGAAADCENDQVCTVCGEKLADKLGHTPGAAADCENDQVCTVCGEKLADKLGHTPGAAADCENDQVCTVCGEKLADKLGHTPGAAADCENDQVCTVCGEKLADKLGHTPGAAADCENDQVCTVCGDKLADKLGHTPGAAADCENDQVCTVCGEKLADKLGHTPGAAADCENDQVCTVCGEKLADKLGHTPGAAADCENDQICTVCGEKLADKLGHTPGAAADCENDQVCTVCGEKLADKLGHKYQSEIFEATCTEDGKTVYTCSVCGDTYEEPIVSEGHNYIKGETFAPTHTAKGYTVYTCDKCGDSYEADFVNKLSTAAKNETTGKLYSSLQEAIDEAADGEAVALTKSVKNAATLIVPANKKITIDLKGFYYAVKQVEQGAALVVETGAEVTLKGTGAAKLEAMYVSRTAFQSLIENKGKLTVENVNLYGPNLTNEGAATIINAGTMTLNDGTAVGFYKTALVNTGSITKAESVELAAPEGYHWSAEGVLEAHSYTKTSIPATCVKVSYDLHECSCGASYEDNYGTKKLSIVAKIGDQYYASMAEAIAAAKENDVIVLFKNVKNAETIIVTSGKKITIDLNGKYYAVNQITGKAALIVEEGAELILTGGGKIEAQSISGNKDAFDCVIENNGKLKLENVLVYASNLYATDFAIINNGELTKTADTVISLIKASEMSGNGTVIG